MGLLGNLFGRGGSSTYDLQSHFNADAEKQKRLERYKKTWEAYLAELPDPIVIDSNSNDNVKVNPARAIVNTGVYFLFGNELKFQVSPDSAERLGKIGLTQGTAPQGTVNPKWLTDLNRAWKANRKESFLFNLGLSGAIHGDCFIKFVPSAAGVSNEFPRLLLLDPANVDVEWDPNDCTQVLKFYIEYVTENEDGEPVLRIQEITANKNQFDVIENWTMQDFENSMLYVHGAGYVPAPGERQAVSEPVIWPYAWAPIEHCQNIELPHMFWGLSDLDESSVEVIESLQRSMSSLNKIVRIHASPRMFAKNVMPDQIDEIDVSADNIITLPNMEADLAVLQTLSNLSPSIQFTDKLREDLYEMLQVPPIALGKFESASTAISGVTLSILYAPLLQKTDLKRISYGDMIERINQKLLILMGYTDPEEYADLVLVWPEAMPGSAYLERQTLQQDLQMGVSKKTITAKLGYDPSEEETNRLEELKAETDVATQAQIELQKSMPQPVAGGGETRGGNNNPSGVGNKNGSLGGTKAAGTPKTKES